LHLKPRALVSYSDYDPGKITETGANSLNLRANIHYADSLILGLDATPEAPFILSSESRFTPKLFIGYQYDAMGNASQEHQLTSPCRFMPQWQAPSGPMVQSLAMAAGCVIAGNPAAISAADVTDITRSDHRHH
jgi:hypothetical protein